MLCYSRVGGQLGRGELPLGLLRHRRGGAGGGEAGDGGRVTGGGGGTAAAVAAVVASIAAAAAGQLPLGAPAPAAAHKLRRGHFRLFF